MKNEKAEWILNICEEKGIEWETFDSVDLIEIQREVELNAHKTDFKVITENLSGDILDAISGNIEIYKEKPDVTDKIVCLDRDATVTWGDPSGPLTEEAVEAILDMSFQTLATGNQMLKQELNIPGKREINQTVIKDKNAEDAREFLMEIFNPQILENHKRTEAIKRASKIFPDKEVVIIDDYDVTSHIDDEEFYEPFEYYLLSKRN